MKVVLSSIYVIIILSVPEWRGVTEVTVDTLIQVYKHTAKKTAILTPA